MSADQIRPLGLGALYTRDERTWSVSPWTYGIQGRYSLYLQDQSLQAVRDLERQGYLNPDEVKEQKAQIIRDRTAGIYAFGSPFVLDSFQRSRENLAYLFWLMVSAKNNDFTLEMSRQLVGEDAAGVMDALAQANAPPEVDGPNSTTQVGPGSQKTLTDSSPA
jgi:hypothetical protein